MRSITLDELQPGMYLTRPLIAAGGTVLLHEGIEMKERYIEYLRNKGFAALFVGETKPKAALQVQEDLYDEKHKQDAIGAARESVKSFRVGKGIILDSVKIMVGNLIEELGHNPENMMHFLDIRRKEEYMFSHSVNTCILSIMTGLSLGYDDRRLSELGLAAMLHDIGKTKFSQHLALQYPRYLNHKEKEEYRRHSFYALEILRESHHLPSEVLNACFQHHERWNGSGYPMGLKGDSISEYAQIISIADVYDRLIAGMPNRLPTPVYYAVSILNKAAGNYFNPALVDKFNQRVSVYPMGKTVRLSNKQSALILGVSMQNKTTPVVRLLSGPEGNHGNQIVELDLNKNPELFIIDFEEVYYNYMQAYTDRHNIFHQTSVS